MASHASLSAAADDRKARLAQLKSLKRKQPTEQDEAHEPTFQPDTNKNSNHDDDDDDGQRPSTSTHSPSTSTTTPPTKDVASLHLSGRNYDFATRGPKLGFEAPPTEGLAQPTLEEQARQLEEESRRQAEAEAEAQDAHKIDLFKLQPKRPNWDLKRELNRRMEVLNVRTENAIARMVRERLAEAARNKKQAATAAGSSSEGTGQGDGGEENGEAGTMDGAAMVEGMRLREREEEEENRREREAEDAEFGMA
ncbi:hypothetical protein VTK26DRAFT_127 [Humicola hyalothermophila]